MFQWFSILKLLGIEVFLAVSCILGDYYVFQSLSLINLFLFRNVSILNEAILRAFLDNFIHGLIGLVSWFIVIYPQFKFYELMAAWFFASILDIDHFISARSFRIADVGSLQKRPFFHNSLTLLLINLLLFVVLSYLNSNKRYTWSILFFMSWFSHHIRDGTRRGLFFDPLGTSMVINYNLYILIILLMPLTFRFVLNINHFN